MKMISGHFNWWVVAGVLAAAIVLGCINNLRVYDERRVKWFGGAMVGSGEELQ